MDRIFLLLRNSNAIPSLSWQGRRHSMNESAIQSFIRQTEGDLKLAKEFLAMWRRRSGDAPMPSMEASKAVQAPLIPSGEKIVQGEYGANKRAVLEAVEGCPTEYTIYDVEKVLAENGNPLLRPAISQALSRLSKDKHLTIHRKGGGRKPTVYRK